MNDLSKKYEFYHNLLRRYKKDAIKNSDIQALKKDIEIIYKFFKTHASEFYDRETESFHYYFEFLVDDLLDFERQFFCDRFIIPSEPNFLYQDKLPEKPKIDNPEIIMDWLTYMARKKFEGKRFWLIKNSSMINKCTELSEIIEEICKENDILCYKIRINPGFERDAYLYNGSNFRDICIVYLSKNYYLVDCTYRQFFRMECNSLERIGVPFTTGAAPGIFMTLTKERLKLADTILKRGWIKLTEDNIKNYFDGFALSFRNGLYYKETHDFSYTTSYSACDYEAFLRKEDSQTNHECKEVLCLQKKI